MGNNSLHENPFGTYAHMYPYARKRRGTKISRLLEQRNMMLKGLAVLFCVVYCYGDVKNVCKLKQDLNFVPTGYSCTFVGDVNVYVYQGTPIETIDFDTFNAKSSLIIFGAVDRVVIERGSMDLCDQIDTRNPEAASIIINGKNCENVSLCNMLNNSYKSQS